MSIQTPEGSYEPGSPDALAAVARHELETVEGQLRAARRAQEDWRGSDEGRMVLALEDIAESLRALVVARGPE